MITLEKLEKKIGKENVLVNPVIEKLKDEAKPIIIYGAVALGHEVFHVLCKNSIIPQCFCSGLNGGYVDAVTGVKVICKSELAFYTQCIIIYAIGDLATIAEKGIIKTRCDKNGV